ncbi:MAG: sulfite exporter TauE/SafE family protein [Syntrophales bacterium]|nr:sulfite exporter TauE/SafE family protein [Syntrophales bacterium]
MAGILIGLIAGLLGGFLGTGGGVIIVPLMTETLRFRQHEAHGTSLIAVVFTSVTGSVIYYLHGSVDLAAAAVLAGMALVTVRFGAKYCCFLPEATLKKYFGFFLLVVALVFILKPFLPYVMEGVPPIWVRWIALVLLGALTGFISGMMGVGGGSFMVPVMVIFAGIAQHIAQGVSLLAMIPASTVGAWTHWQRGNIRASRLPGLVAGVLTGVFVGASFAHLIPERGLRYVYTALLLYTALRYLRTKNGAEVVCTVKEGQG